MTFGEKLKEARKNAGLSQEAFAEKVGVSRSAVAKWESDRGLPDVENLKLMAGLLSVSIDDLLEEDEAISFRTLKEPITLDDYEKTGKCRERKDAACWNHFQDADAIYPLFRRKVLTLKETAVDLAEQWGTVQLLDYIDNTAAYYLVERRNRQYLVSVSDEFLCTTELTRRVDSRRFTIGRYRFTKAPYQLI